MLTRLSRLFPLSAFLVFSHVSLAEDKPAPKGERVYICGHSFHAFVRDPLEEMAAAALVTLAGGTRDQAIAAASMAFQSMLGLICDPIANRVEAPCLGKNVMAASNALSCANMSLAGFDPLIPLDEVIDAARHVSTMMPREHRCTSLGGLAITPTSLEIVQKLAALKSKGCGNCRC